MPSPSEKPLNSAHSRPEHNAPATGPRPETTSQTPSLPQDQQTQELVSKERQLAAFRTNEGVEWGDRFVSVMQFKRGDGLFGQRGVKLLEELWKQLRDCRFKRAWELFGSKEDYAVPRFHTSTPIVQYPPLNELRSTSLRAVIFNIDRIPLKLIIDLGIVPEPPHKLTKEAERSLKMAPHVIPTLQAILEAAACITPGNERILVLRQIDAKRYPDAIPLREDRLGSLLYLRENTSINRTGTRRDRSDWPAPQQIVSFYSSIYNALRKTNREDTSYKVEGEKIPQLVVKIADMETRARRSWKPEASEASKASMLEEIEQIAREGAEELKGSKHHVKRECRQQLVELLREIESGSKNITSFRSRLTSVAQKLSDTATKSDRKSGYNNTDEGNLEKRIKRAETAFDLISKSLPRAAELLDREINNTRGYFSRTDLALPVRKVWTNTFLLASAKIPIHSIDSVSERPLRAFAVRMSSAFGQLETSLLDQNPKGAREAIVKMVVIGKLENALAIFEKLKRYTAQSEPVPLDKLTEAATMLRHELERRAIAPETVIPEYQPTYERVEALSRQLSSELDASLQAGRDLSVRTAVYARLREVLDEVDLELDLKNLPA